jgi:hypothetical protein
MATAVMLVEKGCSVRGSSHGTTLQQKQKQKQKQTASERNMKRNIDLWQPWASRAVAAGGLSSDLSMWRFEGIESIDTRDLDRIMAFCSGARETCFLHMTGSWREA